MARLKDSELKALLAEVEQEIGGLIRAEGLSKGEGSPPIEESTPGEASPGVAPGAEGSAASPEASAVPPGEAPGDISPAMGGEEAPVDGAAPGQEQEVDLKSEYLKLGQEDPEALKEHYLACVEALQQILGQGQGQPGAEAAPPAGPPAGAAPAGPPMGEPGMGKMELGAIAPTKVDVGKDHLKANEVTSIGKSEDYEAKIAALESTQGQLIKAFDKFLGYPLRKAVTSIATAGKPGDAAEVASLSRTEVMAKLSEKAKTNLKKSDRERINKYATRLLNFDDIKDLLV